MVNAQASDPALFDEMTNQPVDGVDEAELKDVLTRIAWKNHRNGAKNPRAQFRKEVPKETISTSPLVAGQTVYLGGQFNHVDGAPRANLAAVSATTGAVTSWRPDPNDRVYALAISPDGGTLYAGGEFATIGPSAMNRSATPTD